MNESVKTFLFNNAGALAIALIGGIFSVIFFSLGYILHIRSDLNSTQFQVEALQQSTSPINALVPEVATIKQASIDTNEKVNVLYSHFISK